MLTLRGLEGVQSRQCPHTQCGKFGNKDTYIFIINLFHQKVMKKRLTLLMLLVQLLVPTAWAYDFAQGGVYYNITLAATTEMPGMVAVTSGSELYTGSVSIPASVERGGLTYNVTSIEDEAFKDCARLTSVSIGTSVTFIGYRAFSGCEDLTEVVIPDNVEKLGQRLGSYPQSETFIGCKSLTSATLGAGIRSMGTGVFKGCPNLANVTVADGCKLIGGECFKECVKLRSINLPSSVTSIGASAFEDCTLMTSVQTGDGVKTIGDGAFRNCKHLLTASLGTALTSIEYQAFAFCTDLESITLPDALTTLGLRLGSYPQSETFVGCTSLREATIGAGMTSMGTGVFMDCQNLRNVTIKDGCTVIGGACFQNCPRITDITIPNSVTDIGNSAFSGCTTLKAITIPNSVTNIGNEAFMECDAMTEAVIGDGVTSIGQKAFYGCNHLATATLGSALRTIGFQAFALCAELESIVIPDEVRTLGQRGDTYYEGENFMNCTSLKSVTFGKNVTSMGTGTFMGCTSLSNVTIKEGCTLISNACFKDCVSLETIDIPESVTSVGNNAFSDCTSMTTATVGDGVFSIGASAFEGCTNLAEVTLGANVRTIGYRAFKDCKALKEIVLPDYVTTLGQRGTYYYEGENFMNCTSLRKVTLGKRISAMGTNVFSGCTGLLQVIIKDGLSVIGENCFNGCTNIQTITSYCEDLPATASNAFPTALYGKTGLYVPEASYNLYKETAPWSNFLTIATIEGGVPLPDVEKCAEPEIFYENGQLRMTSATEGATFVTEITDTDIKTYTTDVIDLTVTYIINVYATKEGLDNSDIVTGTLCWIDAMPSANSAVDVTEVEATPVFIRNRGSVLSVSGAAEGTDIAVYNLSGQLMGTAVSQGAVTSVSTSLLVGQTAVVRIGERSVKVQLR